jgi:AcrR family transcriptional regulator
MVATPWGDSEQLRERGLRPGPGIPPDEAAQNQRERLFGAMVASVSERGYAGTRVSDLVELSGVARKSFYRLFADKEACFVATVEAMISIGVAYAVAATPTTEGEAASWEDQMAGVIHGFAEMVLSQPAAARLLLLETHAAGPTALGLLDNAFAAFEALGRKRLAEHPELANLPIEVLTVSAGTVQEMAARRLREGREAELPSLGDELAQLLASIRPPPEPIRMATKPPAFAPETLDAHDRSERALRAFTAVVAEAGYANASVSQAVKRASMSPTTFYASFRNKEDAMMAAIDSAGAQIVAAIVPTVRRNPDWPLGVRSALGTFFNFLASRPSLARLMLVEVYAAGPAAVARREQALAPLIALVDGWHAKAPQVPAVAIEALSGGIFALAFKTTKERGPESLPNLAAISTYFALAPFIGAEPACAAANSDGLPRSIRERHESNITVLQPPEERVRPPSKRLIEKPEWEEFSRPERERISAEVRDLIAGDIEGAVREKTFDSRIDRHLARVPLLLDEQGWAELAKLHTAIVSDTVDIQAKTLKRLEESGEQGVPARSVVYLFEMPDDGDQSS